MNPKEVVYISNIPKQATLADLHGFLKSSGNIVGAAFMRENRNDCRTKIAFVLFENERQALEACNLDQTLFQAHRLSVLLSNDDRKFLAGYTIMIENTSSDTSEEDLFEACCKYGSVEAVQIPTNYYAFVGFAERSAARAAQQKLDNSLLKNNRVQVKVLNEDVQVRLEDLDNFKTPRVYNELLRARQQYYNNQSMQQRNQNSAPVNVNPVDVDQEDHLFDNNEMDGEGFQNFANDSNDFEPMMDNASYFEENNVLQVYRRDVKFGKQRFIPANKTSVKVENVPRDVYDEDVVIYFQQFGSIVSMERGICMSSIFTKVYTITYQDEASQRRAINCFRRQVTLSGVTCIIFTMKPGEALHPVKSKSVLVSYLSIHVLYNEIMEAFANVGDVLYIEKRVRNNGPTIVHFCRPINLNEACRINNIAGNMVYVVPCSQKEFLKFEANIMAFKKAVKGNFKGTPKSNYLAEIEAKEEQEKMENIMYKTVHDPHYRNPNPRKYGFEVVLYNCPKGTTMEQVKNYFKRAAEVLAVRHEPSPFDPNSCKVYVSFGNYLDAYRAVRLKGKLDGEFVYKHIAAESPKLDCSEAVRIVVHTEVNRITGTNADSNLPGTEHDDDGKNQRPYVLLSDILAANIRNEPPPVPEPPIVQFIRTEPKQEKPQIKQEEPPVVRIKQEKLETPEVSRPETNSTNTAPSPSSNTVPSQAQHHQGPSESPDLRHFLAEKRTVKPDCSEKLNDLEEMERIIKQKEMDIKRRLEQLERDEANVTALLPSTSRSAQPADESDTGAHRNRSSQRNSSPPERSSSASTSQRSSVRNAGSAGGDSSSSRLMVTEQNRSISPSDRLAHERYVQIREEKIAITQELNSLRQRFDYRKSSRVEALQDLLAGLDKEQRDIQIQLEAKRRFQLHGEYSFGGTSFDQSPVARRQSKSRSYSRSRSPYRSYSRSRSRHRTRSPSRSRSRSSQRSQPSRRSRVSRSPGSSYRPSYRTTRPRTRSRSRSRSTRSLSPQVRGLSLERDMYNIGRYHTRHGKFCVYVGNISWKVKSREVEKKFRRYGKLDDIDLSCRARWGEIYFEYANREDAFKALEMNNVLLGDRRLRVAFNIEKPANREQYSLFFRIREPTTEQILYQSYEPFGEIDFIWYPEKAMFGTITFRRPEAAKDALVVRDLIDGVPITTRPFIDKLKRGE
ncbi:AGAP001643-PA-like protein [Anopheles sinensis]|uniref:AGAP001643-PA-like protein n=1 Tax=Anopheles sinensis TaxID=74873 RepID=A0A084VGU4_ANOSI|nr:AGAP001643-PA-like protein [Anopheles sinensis]